MEIKINVDELKFKDILEKELNAFSKEELHEIIHECICEYFRNNDIMHNLFTEREGYYSSKRVPGKVLFEAARSLNLAPAFEEIQTLMIEYLKNNHREVVQKAMLDAMISGIAYSNHFNDAIRQVVHQIIREETANNT